MGGTCSRQKPMKILMQGLDAAGKTSLLYVLKLGEIVTTIPTIGFNIETINCDGLELVAWDVGCRGKMRPLLRHYYPGTDGIIYVVDCADLERINQSLDELNKFVIQEEEMQNTVVMVLANKQDLPNAVSAEHIESKIKELCTFSTGVSFFVMPCSVTNMEGLQQAFNLFARHMNMKKEGKLQAGLIPSAWDVANQEALPEETDDVTTEGGDSSSTFHRMKNSLFKDPLNWLKSVLFY